MDKGDVRWRSFIMCIIFRILDAITIILEIVTVKLLLTIQHFLQIGLRLN